MRRNDLPTPVRVVIVDDHEELLLLLRFQLRMCDTPTKIVGEASDGQQAIVRCRDLQPDLVLLDVDMPVLSGLDALPEIRRVAPHSFIAVLSSKHEVGTAPTAYECGADLYLDKGRGRIAVCETVAACAARVGRA